MRVARRLVALFACLQAGATASAAVEAPFIDGAYTMSAQACTKLQDLAKGTPRNVSSVPWSVSARGFDHGEGGCAFLHVTERKKGKEWAISARCVEHGPGKRTPDRYVFTRTSADMFAVRLVTPGTPKADTRAVTYTRCDTGKPK